MIASWKNRALLGCVVVLMVALVVALSWQPALGQREGGSGGYPRYTVVETEGHNLIVTDNRSNILYFYTIDKDAKIGSELKLRGQVNLKQVGGKVIKPENVRLRKE
jgi:hypothetical protein